jgi:hypothetical protein
LRAGSTAAFATPVRWERTVTTPVLPLFEPDDTPTTWFQEYKPYDAAHPGSSTNDPILTGPNPVDPTEDRTPTLTIESEDGTPDNNLGDEVDPVKIGSSVLGLLNVHARNSERLQTASTCYR